MFRPQLPMLAPDLAKRFAKLKIVRTSTDAALKPCALLRDTIVNLQGQNEPMRLRYYQVQAVVHLVAMDRFVLGDDTGLGKTPMCITALCHAWSRPGHFVRRAIILTTKSATDQWRDEIDKFSEGIKVIVCKGSPAQRKKARQEWLALDKHDPSILVMGYRTLVGDFTEWQDVKDYSIIFDEASAFKNPKSRVHQVCKHMAIPEKAMRVWGLSATIIKNHLIEGYGIYKVIVPDLFTTEQAFIDTFCVTFTFMVGRRPVSKITGYKPGMVDFFRQVIDPFFLGRAKFEVASELPTLTTKIIDFKLNTQELAKYEEAQAGLLTVGMSAKTADEKEITKLTAVTYCQQIVNHLSLIDCAGESSKLDELMSLVTEGDLAEEKIIVFSRFKKMIDIIAKTLDKAGIKNARVTGDETEAQRTKAKTAFLDPNGDVRVILLTMAGSDAINLQTAKALVFYDTPWSAGDYLQILGRMIRIGSLHDRVLALHLVAKGTTKESIDQAVMKVMRSKLATVEAVIGKRIKGETDDVGPLFAGNDLSAVFAGMFQDAKKDIP